MLHCLARMPPVWPSTGIGARPAAPTREMYSRYSNALSLSQRRWRIFCLPEGAVS